MLTLQMASSTSSTASTLTTTARPNPIFTGTVNGNAPFNTPTNMDVLKGFYGPLIHDGNTDLLYTSDVKDYYLFEALSIADQSTVDRIRSRRAAIHQLLLDVGPVLWAAVGAGGFRGDRAGTILSNINLARGVWTTKVGDRLKSLIAEGDKNAAKPAAQQTWIATLSRAAQLQRLKATGWTPVAGPAHVKCADKYSLEGMLATATAGPRLELAIDGGANLVRASDGVSAGYTLKCDATAMVAFLGDGMVVEGFWTENGANHGWTLHTTYDNTVVPLSKALSLAAIARAVSGAALAPPQEHLFVFERLCESSYRES
ncbi:uncharacterized protein EHS24_004232 [Apiotrichum porosum]|uniref:Uncharacterized protein n=1 Tax=Apiotrichum porosum TaxID=105984 RepID=A0A427Y4M8_9TREE|nr:uncharacterized protein EHS24_004232 [Apiotrichum porosum]RSH86033.1 hypothetical protein EHS24_004232 [Apiotrichum porosum]